MSHTVLSPILMRAAAANNGAPLDSAGRQSLSDYLSTLAAADLRQHVELFPTREAVLALLVNGYLAWTIALNDAPELANRPVEALEDVRFPFAGGHSTLHQIATEIARVAQSEPRLGLFLNPGWRGGPPPPGAALEGHSLSWQLAEYAERCGRAPGVWSFDQARRELRASEIIDCLLGTPPVPGSRVRQALDLVPPPVGLRAAILATCGATLHRCTVTLVPLDRGRRWRPLGGGAPTPGPRS